MNVMLLHFCKIFLLLVVLIVVYIFNIDVIQKCAFLGQNACFTRVLQVTELVVKRNPVQVR